MVVVAETLAASIHRSQRLNEIKISLKSVTTHSFRAAALCAWPAAALAIAMLLPFLNKAHRGDDVTFLLQARHVLTSREGVVGQVAERRA